MYDELVKNSPDSVAYRAARAQALEALADMKLRQGDRDAAITSLEQAIEQLQPDDDSTLSPLARALQQKQRLKLKRIRDENAN
jgi:tetratricopeptide (TPR) repeat protein